MTVMTLAAPLLTVLTHTVRAMEFGQGAVFLGTTLERFRRVVAKLERQDLVAIYSVVAAVPQAPSLVLLSKDGREPDYATIAAKLRAPASSSCKRLSIVAATARSARMTGGVAPKIKSFQLSHDLGVSGIVLSALAAGDPIDAWRSEDYLTAHKLSCYNYVPDIGVVYDGQVRHSIDFAANYSIKRLRQIHENCVSAGTTCVSAGTTCDSHGATYELWARG